MKAFSLIKSSHKDLFLQKILKLCVLKSEKPKNAPQDQEKKTNSADTHKNKQIMLKPEIEESYSGVTAAELSSNSKKAIVTLVNEIVLSWIRKFETQIIPGSKKFNKNMPKILT